MITATTRDTGPPLLRRDRDPNADGPVLDVCRQPVTPPSPQEPRERAKGSSLPPTSSSCFRPVVFILAPCSVVLLGRELDTNKASFILRYQGGKIYSRNVFLDIISWVHQRIDLGDLKYNIL